jgi:hypothetical protein
MLHQGKKRWVDYVPALVKEYNTTKIEGTSYTRQSVQPANFDHFLTQYLKTDQPELAFNSSAAGPFQSASWNRAIFKFRVGQKVLLSKKAEWKSKHKYHAFTKYSVEGGFSDQTYTVSGMQLRKTKNMKDFVPVYSLREYGPAMHFYTAELKSVNQPAESEEKSSV